MGCKQSTLVNTNEPSWARVSKRVQSAASEIGFESTLATTLTSNSMSLFSNILNEDEFYQVKQLLQCQWHFYMKYDLSHRTFVRTVHISKETNIETQVVVLHGEEMIYKAIPESFVASQRKYNAKEFVATEPVVRIQQQMVTEILILSKLSHPNIIEFRGFSLHDANDINTLGYYTGFVGTKNAHNLFHKHRRRSRHESHRLEWLPIKLSIAIGVARALTYLHAFQPEILHRNVKAEKVLLEGTEYIPRLCGFGVSRMRTVQYTMTAQVGTLQWIAPEVLNGQDYSCKADIYSFGMFLMELITEQVPFANSVLNTTTASTSGTVNSLLNENEICERITTGCLPTIDSTLIHAPQVILQLMQTCIQFDPRNRPDAWNIVEALESFGSTNEFCI